MKLLLFVAAVAGMYNYPLVSAVVIPLMILVWWLCKIKPYRKILRSDPGYH
jgi:hypothetical protein